MDAAARNLVRQPADNRCEYCLLRQEHSHLSHHIEHIVAHIEQPGLGLPPVQSLQNTEHFEWWGPRVEGLFRSK